MSLRSVLFVAVASLLLFSSCEEEFVCETANCFNDVVEEGSDPTDPNDSEIIEDDNIFIDEEGETYFMGFDCGTPTGAYSIPDADLRLEGTVIPASLPESFDLSEFLPPVDSQGIQPSCVSWAVTYYMKSMQEKIESGLTFDRANIMSPAYTYNQLCEGRCTGTSITATLDILKDKGSLPLIDFPYVETECHILPDLEQDAAAQSARISDYKALSGANMVNEMKTLITEQTPIIISAVLDAEFGKKDILNLTAYREHDVVYENAGCHAMLVVGYSDTNNAFKVVNSWGADWGDGGFVWIDYKAFENVLEPDEPFKVINGAYVAFDMI